MQSWHDPPNHIVLLVPFLPFFQVLICNEGKKLLLFLVQFDLMEPQKGTLLTSSYLGLSLGIDQS